MGLNLRETVQGTLAKSAPQGAKTPIMRIGFPALDEQVFEAENMSEIMLKTN